MAIAQTKNETLSGTDKVAIVLLSMGDEFIAETFKHLEKEEVTAISKSILNLKTVDTETVTGIMQEFHIALSSMVEAVTGGRETVKRVLNKTLDTETAKYILDTLNLERETVPFKELSTVSPRILSQILRNEHPQTVALILGHLQSEKAAEVLMQLPEGLKIEVTKRLATLDAIPEEILHDVDNALQKQIMAMGGTEGRKVGGIGTVAEILNATDRATEELVLTELEEENPQIASKIRELMFVFEDIIDIDDKGIREMLKEINMQDLAMALRTASSELKTKIFNNMSERAAKMLEEDMEVMGPARVADIEAAQQRIVKVVRTLEADGKIMISRGANDVLI
ncbi:MAG: flagellar motor switch protein FliG [Desulfovibrionaceae bacterium]|nr:flagellar motor switch protein FliG [Desulfovibrionaceae bacterium]